MYLKNDALCSVILNFLDALTNIYLKRLKDHARYGYRCYEEHICVVGLGDCLHGT